MSRPNRVRILLVLAFVLTLGAGLVAGIGISRIQHPAIATSMPTPTPPVNKTPASPHDRNNWIADQLKLNPEQREKVNAIWKDAPHSKVRELDGKRWGLYRERDEKLAAVLTAEQKAERERLFREHEKKSQELRKERDQSIAALYTSEQNERRDKIKEEYSVKIADAGKQREALLAPMVEQTRKLLIADQVVRFDEMMARGPGPDRFRGPPGRPNSQPTTGPAARPQGDWPGRGRGDGNRNDGNRGDRNDGNRGDRNGPDRQGPPGQPLPPPPQSTTDR